MDGERFGRRVRAFRKLKRMQQAELAKRLSISTTLLGRVERGEKIPTIDLIEHIAELLEVNIQELLGDSVTEKEGK